MANLFPAEYVDPAFCLDMSALWLNKDGNMMVAIEDRTTGETRPFVCPTITAALNLVDKLQNQSAI